jgi:hypothetical protein
MGLSRLKKCEVNMQMTKEGLRSKGQRTKRKELGLRKLAVDSQYPISKISYSINTVFHFPASFDIKLVNHT